MADSRTGSRSINSTIAAVFGIVYTLVGLAGFFVSETFAGTQDNDLLGFQVNHLHNIVHLLIGLALLAASRRHDTARSANLAIGATYLLLGVLGPVINGSALDIIALNGADNVLHLLIALAGIAAGLASRDDDRRAATA